MKVLTTFTILAVCVLWAQPLSYDRDLSELQKRFHSLPIAKAVKVKAEIPDYLRHYVLSPQGDMIAGYHHGWTLGGKPPYIWVARVDGRPISPKWRHLMGRFPEDEGGWLKGVVPYVGKGAMAGKLIMALTLPSPVPSEYINNPPPDLQWARRVSKYSANLVSVDGFSQDSSALFFTATPIDWPEGSIKPEKARFWKWLFASNVATPVSSPVRGIAGWSPDGAIRLVTFSVRYEPYVKLSFQDGQTGKIKVRILGGAKPHWSPNSRWVAYYQSIRHEGQEGLWCVGRDGKKRWLLLSKDKAHKQLLSLDSRAKYVDFRACAWLPNSRSLLVCLGWSESKENRRIDHDYLFLLQLDGKMSYLGRARLFCASPDGKHIILRIDGADWVMQLRG